MAKKGIAKSFSELTDKQKADVRKRMKPPYAGYLYKIVSGKVAYRFRDRPATVRPDPLGLRGKVRFIR